MIRYITSIAALCFCTLSTACASEAQAEASQTGPRLFFNTAKVNQIREGIEAGELKPSWDRVYKNASSVKKQTLSRLFSASGVPKRELGNGLATLSVAALISGDPDFYETAKTWALTAAPTSKLAQIEQYHSGLGLDYAHLQLGLAMFYDYFQDRLSNDERETIESALYKLAERTYSQRDELRIAHFVNGTWINALGMMATAVVFKDKHADSEKWLNESLRILEIADETLSADGATPEGPSYWGYGVVKLMLMMELAEANLGIDFSQSEFWKNTAYYPIYLQLPMDFWGAKMVGRYPITLVDLADSRGNHWYGPDYIYSGLAAMNNDPIAQGMAAAMVEKKATIPVEAWTELLWFNSEIEPVAIAEADLPTLRFFENMGIVSARTDWSGDENLLVFKAGEYAGEAYVSYPSRNGIASGHAHPDGNHFCLFANGEFIIPDTGYVARQTELHNTLMIDGVGQYGQVTQHDRSGNVTYGWWTPFPDYPGKELSRVIKAESSPELDRISGDATAAYGPELGLEKFQRHLLFMKPNVLIVIDEIKLDKPRDLMLTFHTAGEAEMITDVLSKVTTGNVALRMELMTPINVRMESSTATIPSRHGRPVTQTPCVKLHRNSDSWFNVIAFSWSESTAQPAQVQMNELPDGTLVFSTDGRTATFVPSEGITKR